MHLRHVTCPPPPLYPQSWEFQRPCRYWEQPSHREAVLAPGAWPHCQRPSEPLRQSGAWIWGGWCWGGLTGRGADFSKKRGHSHNVTCPRPQNEQVSRVGHDLQNQLVRGTAHHRPPGRATMQSAWPALASDTHRPHKRLGVSVRKVPCAQPAFGITFNMPNTHHLQPLPVAQSLPASCSAAQSVRSAQRHHSFPSPPPSAGICFLLPSLPPAQPPAALPSAPGPLPAPKSLPKALPHLSVCWGEAIEDYLPQAFSVQNKDGLSNSSCIQHLISWHFINVCTSQI